MTVRKITLNGKFLSAPSTGVHRVAQELGNAFADLVVEGHPSASHFDLALAVPVNGLTKAAEMRIPSRLVGPFKGTRWEQFSLPLTEREATILNLCNVGPVIARNAVTMIHDVQVHLSPESYSKIFRLWYHMVQPLMARRHRHILTVSEFSRQEIAKAGLCPLDHISVIHNGVDHVLRMQADESIISRLGIGNAPFVIALSTVQAHKNIGVLMKAFADPRLNDVNLVLFGGTSRVEFEARGVTVPRNVIFAGRVSDNELRGLIEHALCLAFPSTTEGFGLPPLEAMLLGCPALVAPCGALPEICGEASVYCAPDLPEDWIVAVSNFARDSALRNRYSQLGVKHAAQFTWRKSAITLAEVLTSIDI